MNDQYYPCIKDWDSGNITKRVGPEMSWNDAIQYLKQHYSGAWERAIAAPQPSAHPFFHGEQSTK